MMYAFFLLYCNCDQSRHQFVIWWIFIISIFPSNIWNENIINTNHKQHSFFYNKNKKMNSRPPLKPGNTNIFVLIRFFFSSTTRNTASSLNIPSPTTPFKQNEKKIEISPIPSPVGKDEKNALFCEYKIMSNRQRAHDFWGWLVAGRWFFLRLGCARRNILLFFFYFVDFPIFFFVAIFFMSFFYNDKFFFFFGKIHDKKNCASLGGWRGGVECGGELLEGLVYFILFSTPFTVLVYLMKNTQNFFI